jgi:chromosome segregation ATPase
MNTITNNDIIDDLINNPIYMNLMRNIYDLQTKLKESKNENEKYKVLLENGMRKKENKNLQKKYDILEKKYDILEEKCDKLKEKIKKKKVDEEEKKRIKKEKQQAKEDERLRQEKLKEEEKEKKFNKYFEERIIKAEVDTMMFGKPEVFDDFRQWFSENYGRLNIVGQELYEFLNKKIGPYKKKGWWGYKINYMME